MSLEDIWDKPGFWILGGVGSAMVLLGWIWSRKADWVALPLWQVLVTLIIIWVASAFFSAAD